MPHHTDANWVVGARNGKLLFQFDFMSVPAVVGKRAFVTPEVLAVGDVDRGRQ